MLHALLVLRSPAKRDVGGCSLLFVALRSVRDRSSNYAPWRDGPQAIAILERSGQHRRCLCQRLHLLKI